MAKVARLVLAIALFANTVTPGVCAALCSLNLPCPFRGQAPAGRMPPADTHVCPLCHMSEPSKRAAINSPSENCCAWIAKRADPPSAFIKVTSHLDPVAVALPHNPPVDFLATYLEDRQEFFVDDRAPPKNSPSLAESRAPPTS